VVCACAQWMIVMVAMAVMIGDMGATTVVEMHLIMFL
jgi:hypothetical protein